MPEGDSVYRAAKRLRAGLEGHELTSTDFRVPKFATVDLSGRVVDEVFSHGKHLLIRVGDQSIHSHLKMEGRWDVQPLGSTWRRPAHQARIVLKTADTEAIGYSLGIAEVVPRAAEGLDHLGPDILGASWDLDEAVRRTGSDPDRPIFLALLDQRNLAGLGNEYVNELLFVMGLDPHRPVADVPDLRRVVERGFQMLNANKDRTARTFTGDTRAGRERWIYGRERARCRRCGGRIRTAQLGDRPTTERDTFWCPHCQT